MSTAYRIIFRLWEIDYSFQPVNFLFRRSNRVALGMLDTPLPMQRTIISSHTCLSIELSMSNLLVSRLTILAYFSLTAATNLYAISAFDFLEKIIFWTSLAHIDLYQLYSFFFMKNCLRWLLGIFQILSLSIALIQQSLNSGCTGSYFYGIQYCSGLNPGLQVSVTVFCSFFSARYSTSLVKRYQTMAFLVLPCLQSWDLMGGRVMSKSCLLVAKFIAHSILNRPVSINSSWQIYFFEIYMPKFSLRLFLRSKRKQTRMDFVIVANSIVVSICLRTFNSLRCEYPIEYFSSSRSKDENFQRSDFPWIIFSTVWLQGIWGFIVCYQSCLTSTQFIFFLDKFFFSVLGGAASLFISFFIASQYGLDTLRVGSQSKSSLILSCLQLISRVLLSSSYCTLEAFVYLAAIWNPIAF